MPRSLVFALSALVCAAPGCAQPEIEVATAEVVTAVAHTDALEPEPLPVAPMPHLPGPKPERELTDPDLDPKIEAALPDLERLDKKGAEVEVVPNLDVVGLPEFQPEKEEPKGASAFSGRNGATKEKLLKTYGGTADTEKAVALGLAWLAKQQKQDGGWEFDGTNKDRAAATGMALTAFLGAGITHKKAKEKTEGPNYEPMVAKGISFLTKLCPLNGASAGRMSSDSYANAIAALALIEAYGMTTDAVLKPYAQAAANAIQKAQGANGSWGYSAGANGDTSITGWQLQALFAAKQSKLVVADQVIKRAMKFLDTTASGNLKAMYGYTESAGAGPGTSLTAIGLLSRHRFDGWGPKQPGFAKGVEGLLKQPLPKNQLNTYYLTYAALVMKGADGDEWQTWNEGPKAADGARTGGFRDVLTGTQVTKAGANAGSWDPDLAFIGKECGRLGTTALCVTCLETYYRYMPLYKREVEDK